jgi:hypothetical protein
MKGWLNGLDGAGDRRRRIVLAATVGLVGCASARHPTARIAGMAESRPITASELLLRPAAIELRVHPKAIARDRIYGGLLKRASSLAAAYAGPNTVGTTTLSALERTDEVDISADDGGAIVVVLQGVSADLDVRRIVDEMGNPVWNPVAGDTRRSFGEYEATNGSQASLFVLPHRNWIIAVDEARGRARAAIISEELHGLSFSRDEEGLADLMIRGDSLVRRQASLQVGTLAPLGAHLQSASFELTPGLEGVIVARLTYADSAAAAGAERTASDVVAAFRRKLEEHDGEAHGAPATGRGLPPLHWLAAAGVARTDDVVRVRAPIPRSWLDAIAKVDVPSLPLDPAQGSAVDGCAPTPLNWGLWHHRGHTDTVGDSIQRPQTDDPQKPRQSSRSPLTEPNL